MRESPPLAAWLKDSRVRTLSLTQDLTDAQLMGPRLKTVNPLLWELGHVAWFQEHWVLRHARGSKRELRDDLYDSSNVPHDSRWTLPLPSREETLHHLASVQEEVLSGLEGTVPSDRERYFLLLTLFHEDMHAEAFLMTRQTLAYPALLAAELAAPPVSALETKDAHVPGGAFILGASPSASFAFDNEKRAHEVAVAPFSISRAPVSQSEFSAFVEAGGYSNRAHWAAEGWAWRGAMSAQAPVCWRHENGRWERRVFDQWVRLEPDLPVMHVNAFEAEAFCRWAGRRLPTEAEWEMACAGASSHHANLDGMRSGPLCVTALPQSDSDWGCRQMLGNVWEWTQSVFEPFPGFEADPYEDYSRPWFGTHRVLKGGCFATRSRMIRPSFRNFYTPDRRDVFAGFRTCAL